MDNKECTHCKKLLTLDKFKTKKDGKFTKRCIICDNKKSPKCEHNNRRNRCRECKISGIGGESLCSHNKPKDYCKECKKIGEGGGSICIHQKRRNRCKECKALGIGGESLCIHNIDKSDCKKCMGGSICIHNKVRNVCRECNSSYICEHNVIKRTCQTCDPIGHLKHIVSSRVQSALKSKKDAHTIDYLGTDIKTYKKYLEDKFKEGMTWDNHGSVWHIDHVVPILYDDPDIEEVKKRLHYTNTQPLLIRDNLTKGNRYVR